MKRAAKVIVVLFLLVGGGSVAWQRWGDDLYLYVFLTRARSSWHRLHTCRAKASLELGRSGISVDGEMLFRKPWLVRLQCGTPNLASSLLVVGEDRAWVVAELTPLERAVVEVKLAPADLRELGARGSVVGWLERTLQQGQAKLLPSQRLDGRDCWVLGLTPAPVGTAREPVEAETPRVADELAGLLEDLLRVTHVTLYVDKRQMLPVRAELDNAVGRRLATLSLRDLQVNPVVPDDAFEYEVPRGARVTTLDLRPQSTETAEGPPITVVSRSPGDPSW